MANTILTLSTILMGAILVGTMFWVVRGYRWRHYSPRLERREPELPAVLYSPTTWSIAFLAVTIGASLGVVGYLGSSAGDPFATVAAVAVVQLFTLVGVFLVVGIYRMARFHGFGRPMAVAIGSWVVGLVFLTGVTIDLVVG